MKDEILKDLNLEQKKAVTFGQGPFLIIAGAGTGKTTVITKRIAWLILSKGVKPEEILAVTFTEKAAEEMEERVERLLPIGYFELWISTFHSFGERILKDHALEIGLPDDFKLLNQTEQNLLIRQNLDRFNLDYYRPLGNPTKFISALVKHFSRAKDEEIWPEEYLEYVKGLKLNKDIEVSNIKCRARQCLWRSQRRAGQMSNMDEIKRLEEIANAYHVYQQLLLENSALDFGDLINYTLKLFRQRPHILEKYRQQFKYILIDEFQDTNWAQYELIKLLAAPQNNLTVCADDDQCLPPGILISTPEGRKKIEEIKKNDKIITAVGKGCVSVSKVNKVFKRKKKARFLTIKTKKGYQLEVTDNHKMFCFIPIKIDNTKQAKEITFKLQKLTNEILESSFAIGKVNVVSQKTWVMPARNILPGLFVPIFIFDKEIIYDQVIDIKERIKESIVYDLEIDKTHNFIANGIVVHNSIYKFRGASISNVLQFKKDYPQAKEVVLVKNYRSKQNILDLAYKFIQLNNPNRLEWQLQNT